MVTSSILERNTWTRPRLAMGVAAGGLPPGGKDRRRYSGAVLYDRARLHVVHVARGKDVVGLFPGLIHASIVVYGNLPLSDHLEPIPGHHDGRAFRQADSVQIRILL